MVTTSVVADDGPEERREHRRLRVAALERGRKVDGPGLADGDECREGRDREDGGDDQPIRVEQEPQLEAVLSGPLAHRVRGRRVVGATRNRGVRCRTTVAHGSTGRLNSRYFVPPPT